MTEPAGPQLVPTSSHRSGATVVFGLTALIWTVWLGAIASALSDHELLAVGAVLLLGGFFYQRLSAQFDER
jgi:1,4-dihydroxy-2-naphthoate octaprenyltransferase